MRRSTNIVRYATSCVSACLKMYSVSGNAGCRGSSRHAYPLCYFELLRQASPRHARHRSAQLIIDEIGYLPMSREQANLFFQIPYPTEQGIILEEQGIFST